MNAPFRTDAGGLIDRTRPLNFTFDGRGLRGLQGDTLASALLANGVCLMGRSFKYHRPRGVLSAGPDEPNALISVKRDAARVTPNLRATEIELYEGLDARSQNRWPSLTFDAGAVARLIAPFISAGFYYKTFMWPRKAWDRLYEPLIRAAAGLGEAPAQADPDRYASRYGHCDVLVIGAGPAGLAAAQTAAASGARVMICDEQPVFGGSLLNDGDALVDDLPAQAWLARAVDALASHANVVMLPRTTAFGYFAHNLIGLCQRLTDHLASPQVTAPRERLWQVRAKSVVICAGALERPLVFPGNDRPGVMLAEAARTYLHRYGVKPGRRVGLVTAHDGAYRTALDLQAAGVEIAFIADVRAEADGAWPKAARAAGLPVKTGMTVTGTTGGLRVTGVTLASVDGRAGGGAQRFACDALLMSGGFTPSIHLHSQSRGKLVWSDKLKTFLPGAAAERARSAGACRGVFGLGSALEDGARAGAAAAAEAGFAAANGAADIGGHGDRFEVRAIDAGVDSMIGALPQPSSAHQGDAFVDWQNDVTVKDLLLATREGFRSIEHVKRYTTTGMATDQGKTSNINALGVVAEALGAPVADVGLTTFRMPYTPVTFGALAGLSRGDLFEPVRTTPIHDWAVRQGAVFEDVGAWKRARFFPRPGEDMHAAVARECAAVRGACGIFDASTLGKIELVGPDAALFMNRMYVNAWTRLGVGKCRYGLLLGEDGFVLDDGVVGRIAADRFHITTTTGGAARVLAMMEDYLQTEWPDLKVWATSTTEQWAVIALQGPHARRILEGLVEGADVSPEALPHMSLTEGRIRGVPARLFRVSFSGELGFEVNVPADYGPAVWNAIWEAGQAHGLTPYGTEAMHVLRAEKGFIIVGQETDGTATPDDLGLSWAIGKTKPDFVGKRSLARPSMGAPDRKQLVGLLTDRPDLVLEEGVQIVALPGQPVPRRPIGHVTSSYWSATLGRSIALAMVSGGRSRLGETLHAATLEGDVAVQVTAPIFHDPEGGRVNV
jgi:sarcosine oxidase subunit alpha